MRKQSCRPADVSEIFVVRLVSALRPEADIRLESVQRSANDPKRTSVL